MKNKLLIIIVLLLSFGLFMPPTYALSDDYEDKVANIVDASVEDDVINIYFFYGDGCPHCAKEEKFFEEELEKKYKNIKI